MNKRILALILSVLLTVSMLGACSKPAEDSGAGTPDGNSSQNVEPAGNENGGTGSGDSAGNGVVSTSSKANLTVSSYEELYRKINARRIINYITDGFSSSWGWAVADKGDMTINDMAVAEESSDSSLPAFGQTGTADFSDTNVQVDGVMEGDLIKTDGSFIYVLDQINGKITILKLLDAGKVEKLSVIDLSENGFSYINEMYLSAESKKLIAVGSHYEYNSGEKTVVLSFDISDPASVKQISRLVQDGYYQSSRMSDGYLYVFSHEWKNTFSYYYSYPDNEIDKDKPETYIPSVNGEVIPVDCIYIPSDIEALSYTVITSVEVANPDTFRDTKSIIGSNCDYYVSGSSIYLLNWEYDSSSWTIRKTTINRLAYEKGMINHVATGIFDGCIKDQFAMDESNGYFRVCATVYNSQNYYNAVYVLDGDLKIVGTLSNIAPNERIYSARYFGDIVYFVTYRETDPLFSVDLSDPANPKMLGELHLPGYSEYLHPYGENRLLGFGVEEVYNEQKGYSESVLKLSMFDTTDPVNLKELHTLRIDDYTWSELLGSHRALVANPAKNLICFPATSYDYNDGEDTSTTAYLVFGYSDASGFERKLESGFKYKWEIIYYGYEDWKEEPVVIDEWTDDYNPYANYDFEEYDLEDYDLEDYGLEEYDTEEYDYDDEPESWTTEPYNPYDDPYSPEADAVEYYDEYTTDCGYVKDFQVAVSNGYYDVLYNGSMRGIYVNDVLYVVNLAGNVKSYRLSDFERIANEGF